MRATILAVPMLLLAATMAVAQPADRERGPRPERMRAQRAALIEDLQLTDAQQAQFKKLQIEQERKQTQIQSKIKLARLDIRELFQAEKPDKGAIEKGMRAVSDLQLQAKTNHLDHWFAVYNILTPEQQVKWKEHFAHRGPGPDQGMRHFGNRMRGRM